MTNKGNSSATLLFVFVFVFVAVSVAVAGYFTGLQAPMKASSVESPLLVAADKVTHTT